METSLKTGFAQIFSCCPKNLSCPNFGGAAAPLAPPARTPMKLDELTLPRPLPLFCRSRSKLFNKLAGKYLLRRLHFLIVFCLFGTKCTSFSGDF